MPDVAEPDETLPPRIRRWMTWLPGAWVAAIAWLVAAVMPLVAGAFWPVAAAPIAWHERALRLAHDPISPLPVAGGDWVLQPWLPALAMWGSWELGGVAGLVLLNTVVSALVGWLIYLIARGLVPRAPAALAAVLVLPLLMPLVLRPEQFAIALGALLILELRGRRWWWTPIVIVALWSNVHGSFPIALVACVGGALGMVRMPPGEGGATIAAASVARRAAWIAGCSAATLCTPLGVGVWSYVRRVQGIPGLDALTPIWRPMSPLSWRGLLVIALLVVVIAFAAAMIRAGRSPIRFGAGVLPLLPVLVFAALAFDALRNVIWFALVVTPEVAVVLAWVWQRRGWSPDIRSPLVAGVICGVLGLGAVWLNPLGSFQRHFALIAQPPAPLLRDIDRHDTVLASAEWADYLRVRTGARVVVDARLERYRPADLRRYLHVTSGAACAGDGAAAACLDGVRATALVLRGKTAGRLIARLEADASGWCRRAHAGRGDRRSVTFVMGSDCTGTRRHT